MMSTTFEVISFQQLVCTSHAVCHPLSVGLRRTFFP